MQKTNIEYLDYTWNPVKMLCSPVSAGCQNCWHLSQARMRRNNSNLSQRLRDVYSGKAGPYLDENELNCRMPKKPYMIGVQFMGDLFHETVRDEWIDKVIVKIIANPQHTFLLLTKRPMLMAQYFDALYERSFYIGTVPVPNLWLGVTVENQEQADKRIPILIQIPAVKRFISIEPMLERVEIKKYFCDNGACKDFGDVDCHNSTCLSRKIDWVICGQENAGKKSRLCSYDDIGNLRDQCVKYGVPFFLKQAWCINKLVKMPYFGYRVWDQYPESEAK